MEVEIKKKTVIVCFGICLTALLFGFLFLIFGPGIEKVTFWLPNNYQLMDTPQEGKDNRSVMPVLSVEIEVFKDFFRKYEDKVEVSITNESGNYNIVYRNQKPKFIIESVYKHRCPKKHISESVKIDQTGIILFLEYKRDWFAILFCFVSIFFVLVIVFVFCYPEKPQQ